MLPATSYHSVPVGVVVGSIFGGLVAVATISFTLLFFQRKRRSPVDPEPNYMPFGPSNVEWQSPDAAQPHMAYTSPVLPPPDMMSSLYAQSQSLSNADPVILPVFPVSTASSRNQHSNCIRPNSPNAGMLKRCRLFTISACSSVN